MHLLLSFITRIGAYLAMLLGAGFVSAAEPVKALFGTHCAPCHGSDGRARTPIGRKMGVKDLTQSKSTDAEIRKQIREGTRDAADQPRMPAFQGKLSDADIESLIAYSKSLRR